MDSVMANGIVVAAVLLIGALFIWFLKKLGDDEQSNQGDPTDPDEIVVDDTRLAGRVPTVQQDIVFVDNTDPLTTADLAIDTALIAADLLSDFPDSSSNSDIGAPNYSSSDSDSSLSSSPDDNPSSSGSNSDIGSDSSDS